MIGKEHKNLLRDIDGYINVLSQSSTLSPDDFFKKSSYKAGTGKTYPCYKLTRKGCDMVANKLIGAKGILFTAEYVTRFEEMEKQLQTQNYYQTLMTLWLLLVHGQMQWKPNRKHY